MRTIRVDEPESDRPWLWLATGAVIGLTAGVLLSRRLEGRTLSARALVGRGRRLAGLAAAQFGPLMDAALAMKEAWDQRDAPEDEFEEEFEAATEPDLGPDAESDLEAELDDEELAEAEAAEDGIDARVLEAFANDPILSARAVEIEEDCPGSIVLHGRVRSAKEIRHALTLARGVPGVDRVRERLTIPKRPR